MKEEIISQGTNNKELEKLNVEIQNMKILINELTLKINKKEDDIKNIINEKDNIIKEMNVKLLNQEKENKNELLKINNKNDEIYEKLNLNDNKINNLKNENNETINYINNNIVKENNALIKRIDDKYEEMKQINQNVNNALKNEIDLLKVKDENYIFLKIKINSKETGKDIKYLNQNNDYNFYKNFEINDIIVIVDDKISDVKYRKISEYKYDENSKNCEKAQEIYYNLKTPHYFFLNFSTKGIHSIKIIFKKILTSYKKLFSNCKNLIEIDFSHFQCSNYVDSFEQMFSNCNNLTSLDVSHFNTKNSTSFESMFEGCTKLQNIDLSNFNSSKCENISKMFMNCKNITEIDMINFDLKNLRYNIFFYFWGKNAIDRLFDGCNNLRMISLNTNFNEEIMNRTSIFEGISPSGTFIYRKENKRNKILEQLPYNWQRIEI